MKKIDCNVIHERFMRLAYSGKISFPEFQFPGALPLDSWGMESIFLFLSRLSYFIFRSWNYENNNLLKVDNLQI